MKRRKNRSAVPGPATQVRDALSRHLEEERREALRALLMCPLMSSAHPAFGAVRRHATVLRDWFAQTARWILQVERECARLYKRPADLNDPSRGVPEFDRRRYVLFCLACGALERAQPQITLRVLGESYCYWVPSLHCARAVSVSRSSRTTSGATW